MLKKIILYQIFDIPLITFLGILALLVLLCTAFLAIKKRPRRFMKWHHRMTAFSILLAFVHGTLEMMVGGVFGVRLMDYGKSEVVGDVKSMQGVEIFKDYCMICHPKGGNIITPQKPLIGSKRLKDFDTFLAYIRNPGKYEGPQSPMPTFSKSQISDEAAKELYLHIISIQNTETPKGERTW